MILQDILIKDIFVIRYFHKRYFGQGTLMTMGYEP